MIINTKEAVYLLLELEKLELDYNSNTISAVVKFLEKQEKYQQIYEEIRDVYCTDEGLTHVEFERLKQKYFPEPIKEVIIIEVEAKNISQYNWFRNYIIDAESIKVQDGYIKVKFGGEKGGAK